MVVFLAIKTILRTDSLISYQGRARVLSLRNRIVPGLQNMARRR